MPRAVPGQDQKGSVPIQNLRLQKEMKIPFHLDALGYKPDPHNQMRFIPAPDKPHFHPVEFDNERSKTLDECVEAIAEASYQAGYADGCEADLSDPGITDAERI